jgi:hypothetical protein
MLIPLLLALSLSSGRAPRLLEGQADSARIDPDSKWTYAFPQFLAGVGGAALGGLGGAVTGGLFGFFVWMGDGQKYQPDCNTVCTPDAGSQIATGARIGALVGGALGVTKMVIKASPNAFPSSNPLGTFAGAVVGGGMGWIATRSMLEDDGGYLWPRWGILALSSSLGAVLADRYWTSSLPVTVMAWVPAPGTEGVKVGVAF